MEAPKRKVTAKLSSHDVNHSPTASTSAPSPPPQLVVRAKVSGTARARTRTTSTTSASASLVSARSAAGVNGNANGNLRPQARAAVSSVAMARRSPSPSKLNAQRPIVRAPLSKVATASLKPAADRTRHGSISSMLSLASPIELSTSSAPTTPLPPTEPDLPSITVNAGSGSVRIKSKVSGLVKPGSLSTVMSPPPSSIPAPAPTPRTRATTIATRRPSISSPQSQSQPQLVPLPTSPPTSTLSFSSRSSTSVSASASSAHGYSTSATPPLTFTKHARSDSAHDAILPSVLDEDPRGESSTWQDEPHDPPSSSPPLKCNIVARVRPGTNVSGGREWSRTESSAGVPSSAGWTAGSSISAGQADDGGAIEDMSEQEVKALTKPDDNEEEIDAHDDVRAEAKSNRKIADLEITTRSLLAINASLEASKLRQAREIRELRRKLRETRLVMPPGKYRRLVEEEGEEEGEDEADAEDVEDVEEEEGEEDEAYKRLKSLLEGLVSAGRAALLVPSPALHTHPPAHHTSDHPAEAGSDSIRTGAREGNGEVLGWERGCEGKGGTTWKHGVAIGSRVLSAEEARCWAEGEEGGDVSVVMEEGDHAVGESKETAGGNEE